MVFPMEFSILGVQVAVFPGERLDRRERHAVFVDAGDVAVVFAHTEGCVARAFE